MTDMVAIRRETRRQMGEELVGLFNEIGARIECNEFEFVRRDMPIEKVFGEFAFMLASEIQERLWND